MIDGETGMALIREALMGVIEPRAASAVIFEALASQEIPRDVEGLLAFARGPLRERVVERIGVEAAADVVAHVEKVFSRVAPPEGRGDVNTLEVPVGEGPVRVVVVSANASLAVALRASLGGDRVAVGSATGVEQAQTLGRRIKPDVWIIDALDPIDDPLADLVELLVGTDAVVVRLVWAAEQPWGGELVRAMEERDVGCTQVDRREGVEPLLDLIRSRRSLSP
jgi:hypothetical protein